MTKADLEREVRALHRDLARTRRALAEVTVEAREAHRALLLHGLPVPPFADAALAERTFPVPVPARRLARMA